MPQTVSVITPSYNQGEFIEETIRSVLSQEGDFRLEYLVMDGGSADATVSVLKRYEGLLKDGSWPIRCAGIEFSWVSERDRGQADAVNKGFKRAKGEILGWLNSDDTYLPGAVAKAASYLGEHGDAAMVYGEGYHVDASGKVMERYYTEPFGLERLAETCFICQPTVFLRRSAFEKTGPLDASLHYCMDYDYWIRVGKRLKVGYMPEYLANSRMYAENKTMSKRLEAHAEIVATVKRHYGYVPNHWVYAYTRLAIERRFFKMEGPARPLFKALWAVYFVLKSAQLNRRLPALPAADLKEFLGK